jgi:hypothetical protein
VGLELETLSLTRTIEEIIGRKKEEEGKKRKKQRRTYLYNGKLRQLKGGSISVFMYFYRIHATDSFA